MRRPVGILLLLVAITWSTFVATEVHAQINPPDDPYGLVLIPGDLSDAGKTISLRDVNDDGVLDKDEQQLLTWKDPPTEHDLNHDGKLSHLEIAVRFASARREFDVEQIDRTVADRAIRKRDTNRNGQIDPDEITAAWPEEPDEIDVNSDGVLTHGELTQAFAFRRVIRQEIGIVGVDQGWAIKIRNRHDQNADGGLNPDEWTNTPMPGDPKAFDDDKDNRLSVMEIATLLAKHRQKLGLSASDQMSARALIARLDADFSGVVTAQEWKPYEENFADMITQLKQFDTDKDDAISLLEIETVLSKRRDELGFTDADGAAAKRLMERHDTNRDRRISKSELKETSGAGYLGKDELPQIDRNDDKLIDHEELAKHLARQR